MWFKVENILGFFLNIDCVGRLRKLEETPVQAGGGVPSTLSSMLYGLVVHRLTLSFHFDVVCL